jgi:hypothetical protein
MATMSQARLDLDETLHRLAAAPDRLRNLCLGLRCRAAAMFHAGVESSRDFSPKSLAVQIGASVAALSGVVAHQPGRDAAALKRMSKSKYERLATVCSVHRGWLLDGDPEWTSWELTPDAERAASRRGISKSRIIQDRKLAVRLVVAQEQIASARRLQVALDRIQEGARLCDVYGWAWGDDEVMQLLVRPDRRDEFRRYVMAAVWDEHAATHDPDGVLRADRKPPNFIPSTDTPLPPTAQWEDQAAKFMTKRKEQERLALQDLEEAVQGLGQPWMRSALAAVQWACDLDNEGKTEVVAELKRFQAEQVLGMIHAISLLRCTVRETGLSERHRLQALVSTIRDMRDMALRPLQTTLAAACRQEAIGAAYGQRERRGAGRQPSRKTSKMKRA